MEFIFNEFITVLFVFGLLTYILHHLSIWYLFSYSFHIIHVYPVNYGIFSLYIYHDQISTLFSLFSFVTYSLYLYLFLRRNLRAARNKIPVLGIILTRKSFYRQRTDIKFYSHTSDLDDMVQVLTN